jgi:hypothetical protein
MVAIDGLNELFGPSDLNLAFTIDNSSLEADGVFNLAFDNNGIMQNFHYEVNLGMNYDLLPNSMDGFLAFDISEGSHPEIGEYFAGTVPTAVNYPTSVNGNWGIDEWDSHLFTMGIEIGVDAPAAIWTALGAQMQTLVEDLYHDWTGTDLPAGSTVNAQQVVNTILGSIPNIIQLESTVTDMLGIDEDDGTNSHQYDFYVHRLLAKLPDESSYGPIGMLINDYYEDVLDGVEGSGLPTAFVDELRNQLEFNIADLLDETTIEGTSVSALEIIQQFVPSTLHMYGIGASGPDSFPSFAHNIGIVDELFPELVSQGIALPWTYYVPTDFSFGDAYDGAISYLEAQGTGFTEAEFDELLDNYSVDDWTFEGKSAEIEWEVNGINDIFFTTTGIATNVEDMLDGIEDDFGNVFNFDTSTIWAHMTFHWKYYESGILEDFHIQVGLSVETDDGEALEFKAVFDISEGEHETANTKFTGDSSLFGDIPGYETVFLLVAAASTAFFLYIRKRK